MLNSRSNQLEPLFILGLPRSYTSVVCAMIGQHPQLYGLPETHLLCVETMASWLVNTASAPWPMEDGLLRAVAQLHFGAQTKETVVLARKWLVSHAEETTSGLFRYLADRVFPLTIVDKSPSLPDSLSILSRSRDQFPDARYIHLVRHPRGYGESIMKLIYEMKRVGPIPPTHWLMLITSSRLADHTGPGEGQRVVLDPQGEWYSRNAMIRDFLRSVPADRQLRIRGEEVFAEPDRVLEDIAAWMGLRTDVAAIEEMRHPERSVYACLGPPGAVYGNDSSFLMAPALRPTGRVDQRLGDPVSWLSGGRGFRRDVMDLAREFGYE